MAKKATIIEINGRKYDANTGELISSQSSTPQSPTQPSGGKTIDGFSSHITGTNPSRAKAKSAHDLHKVTQRSQKLHPAAVRKIAQERGVASQPAAKPKVTPNKVAKTSAEREKRAQAQTRSEKITKFGASSASSNADAAKQPVQTQSKPDTPYRNPALKAFSKSTSDEPANDLITKIDPNDVAKNKKEAKKRKVKLAPALAAVAVVLLVGGYLTYINLPNLSLRVAVSRAGLDASLPGYKPTGFNFDGPIAYSPGQVTLKFASETGEYQITQRESSWDSQSLLDNYVLRENKEYVIFQERGLTVYIYDDNQATWVDGGVWYTIESNSSLTSEQILKIAGSL